MKSLRNRTLSCNRIVISKHWAICVHNTFKNQHSNVISRFLKRSSRYAVMCNSMDSSSPRRVKSAAVQSLSPPPYLNSKGSSYGHDTMSEGQWDAGLNSEELMQLVDCSLGPSASVWQPRREQRQQQGKKEEQLLAHLTAETKPSSLAYNVGGLAKLGKFDAALKLMDELAKKSSPDALHMIHQQTFMTSAKHHKQPAAAVAFLRALPRKFHDIRLYNMVLQVCAAGRDYARALDVMDLVEKLSYKKDVKLLTSMINVCRSVGSAERAFKVYQEIKADPSMKLDAKAYGSLIAATAEAMQREISVVHERKDQYVLLERAFQVLEEAEALGIKLQVPAFNSLLVCAGRCGQLARAFQVLDMMGDRGLRPDVITYGSLMEACVRASRQDLAFKIFNNALQEGLTGHVELYTQAVSACKIEGSVDLPRALDIYNAMQRAKVEPDKKFYAALMAVAGKAGRLDLALETLENFASEGLLLTTTVDNALIYAAQRDLTLMRKVYDQSARHGVYPEISQYNRMLDWYATQSRFGDVVSLVCDMVRSGRAPNLNTYRTIINACQRADQAQLALEVYATMRARRIPILQKSFEQTIYFQLLKVCFNQIRYQWGSSSGAGSSSSKSAPGVRLGSQRPVVRLQEAEALLSALRSADHTTASTSGRMIMGAGESGISSTLPGTGSSSSAPSSGATSSRRRPGASLLAMPPENVNWQQQALMLYRDMTTGGHRPNVQVLDKLLGCLRLKLVLKREQVPSNEGSYGSPHEEGGSAPRSSSSAAPGFTGIGMGALSGRFPGSIGTMQSIELGRQPWQVPVDILGAGSNEGRGAPGSPSSAMASSQSNAENVRTGKRYESGFDKRAMNVLEDAMSRGFIPSIKVDEGPATIDLREMPPTISELVVQYVLSAFEKRAIKTGRCQVTSSVTFLVPQFDRNYILWPSYGEKMNKHYSEMKIADVGIKKKGAPAIPFEAVSQPQEARDFMGDPRNGLPHPAGQKPVLQLLEGALRNTVPHVLDVGKAAASPSQEPVPQASASRGRGAMPLTASETAAALSSSEGLPLLSSSDRPRFKAKTATGLAVAAMCKRLKVFSQLDPVKGVIVLKPTEISRWLITKRNFDMNPHAVSADNALTQQGNLASGSLGGYASKSVAEQLTQASEERFRAAPSMVKMRAGAALPGIGRSIFEHSRRGSSLSASIDISSRRQDDGSGSSSDSDSMSTMASYEEDIASTSSGVVKKYSVSTSSRRRKTQPRYRDKDSSTVAAQDVDGGSRTATMPQDPNQPWAHTGKDKATVSRSSLPGSLSASNIVIPASTPVHVGVGEAPQSVFPSMDHPSADDNATASATLEHGKLN
ncbi:hypothetical protein CEUSTIGMA_g1991.t1 [Chlamydomonas eustigma]|uniref:Pentacotripeptide-repeat region of PRORP domain-containing protein n=1 Tax=Chlamydomonas eustigma TaxID=1157962 RepID=A0A250WV97_9CHLO|nr:hypothetical protein CEUSTIGMA_g1991.t1 [Chlamydomonas eustigma]|eukprot:GAX74542.1 hypothetical protein CEUSTIGMA_g1991.t1 [Chlamydomonas eustigma]